MHGRQNSRALSYRQQRARHTCDGRQCRVKAHSSALPLVRNRDAEQRSRLVKMAVAGFTLMSIMLAIMSVMPTIERSLVAADARRVASTRSAFFRTHPEFRSDRWKFRFVDPLDR